jgi:CRISPR system Cascade subunit CasC
MATYLDLHVLHTVPYANLNRDDLGSPKTVTFGGEDRTRVSSQCWKRAARLAIENQLGDAAVRTRRIGEAVTNHLTGTGWDAELARFAGRQIIESAGDGLRVEDGGATSVLLYLPASAITALAQLCQTHRDALRAGLAAQPTDPGKRTRGKAAAGGMLPTAEVNEILTRRNGIISLFGRMLAELPAAGVDGAVQVAHAFTTHASAPQVDFFTAVDDLNPVEERGSGHMNSAEFAAGVFYRYTSINTDDLARNLSGDADAVRTLTAAYLTAFLTAMPGAKKNSTAPFTVPDLAYLAVRTDRPVSLAAAFEAPVRLRASEGYAGPSRDRLADYTDKITRLIGDAGRAWHGHASIDDKPHGPLGERIASFAALVDTALAHTPIPPASHA